MPGKASDVSTSKSAAFVRRYTWGADKKAVGMGEAEEGRAETWHFKNRLLLG